MRRLIVAAVFGFAVTLLVVSLEVPNTFDELLATMRGFFAFAISGWLLYSVWFDHYIFFRRYGLQDNLTLHLSSVLLFVVLFYVYPLKFLFTALMDQLLGFSTQVGSSTRAVVQEIKPAQWPLLLVLFGVGFVIVQLVYFLLYWRAYDLRDMLKLDAYDNPIQNVYVSRIQKIKHPVMGEVMTNVPVKTYTAVSQFWTWSPEEYLKRGPYKR